MRATGETMGELEYSINVAATSYYRGFKVGQRYPEIKKVFIVYGLLTLIALAALLWYKPVAALFLFVLSLCKPEWWS